MQQENDNKTFKGRLQEYLLETATSAGNRLTTHIKPFGELSAFEVYEILKARCDVFTVEQKICYPDMDDIDYDSLHVFTSDEKGLVQAYLRLYMDDAVPREVHMGRVLTREHGKGLGRKILEAGIRAARERMNASQIVIHSQQYCIGFYEKAGFRVCSDVFMEADIPHVTMILNI